MDIPPTPKIVLSNFFHVNKQSKFSPGVYLTSGGWFGSSPIKSYPLK